MFSLLLENIWNDICSIEDSMKKAFFNIVSIRIPNILLKTLRRCSILDKILERSYFLLSTLRGFFIYGSPLEDL